MNGEITLPALRAGSVISPDVFGLASGQRPNAAQHWCALAKTFECALMTGDREFETVAGDVSIRWV